METFGDISAWLTPAIIIGLFLWLRADIRAQEGRFEKRFENFEQRFESFDKRFESFDKRFESLEQRFDKRFESLEQRFDKRFDGMDERMRVLEAGQAEIRGQLVILRDYIVRRNLREPDEAPELAPGD